MLNINNNIVGAKGGLLGAWYGFRLIKGQTETLVTEIGSDPATIAAKPVNSYDMIYPAVVDHAGNVVYKLGGSTGNDLTKKKDSDEASDLTGADGEVMTVFEPFYYRVDIWSDGTDTYEDWKFSLYPLSGFAKTPRFFWGIYPAYYNSGSDIIQSVSAVTQETNQTRDWFRQKAANIGSGWCIEPYFMYNIIYHLWVAESLNLNSQEAISTGATNANSGDWDTFCSGKWPVWETHGGALSSYADPDGNLIVDSPNSADVRHGEISLTIENWGDGTKTLNTQIAVMFHIRNPFGHIWKFKDGLNLHNSSENGARAYTSHNPGDFADDTETGYNLIGNIAENDGYVSEFLNKHMLPTQINGGSSEHVGDYHFTYYDNDPNSGWRGAYAGGILNNGSLAGPADFKLANGSTVNAPTLGARLCKIFE
ncbi:MAG: hypothetical protein KGY70_19830 [Bacteroidales bacterium]|nr:hypothetical protein [Bacteroidales bacterium]